MPARVTEPVAYQAFQHFVTHAPWNAEASGDAYARSFQNDAVS
jgi:hypothetical protein